MEHTSQPADPEQVWRVSRALQARLGLLSLHKRPSRPQIDDWPGLDLESTQTNPHTLEEGEQ